MNNGYSGVEIHTNTKTQELKKKRKEKHGVWTERPSYFQFDSMLGNNLWCCTVFAHTKPWPCKGGDVTQAQLNKHVLCDKLGRL